MEPSCRLVWRRSRLMRFGRGTACDYARRGRQQRLGSTVSLRRRSSPGARIRQPSESDNRHSNNRRKSCCCLCRLRVRAALPRRCGKECRLVARPIQPRLVRRRRSQANSTARSHKRQRARSRAIVTDASPSFCAFAWLVAGACQFEPCIMRLAHGISQHSGSMNRQCRNPRSASQRTIVWNSVTAGALKRDEFSLNRFGIPKSADF